MIEEEEKNNYSNTFHKKVQQMVETLGTEIDKVTGKKKSTWKKEVKEKVISKVKKKMIEVMTGKTKAEQKQICRLHILELKANYGRKIWNMSICQSEEDTTEHVLEYNKGDKKFNLNDERGKEWGEILEIYRNNNENISIDNVEEREIYQKKRRKEKIVEKDRC